MNIQKFGQKVEKYKAKPLLFTSMTNSTSSIEGMLLGVRFVEQDLLKLLKSTPEIPIINSNWGSSKDEKYVASTTRVKSNRGRKKKEKPKKSRKTQGDGSNFNSCIQIAVLGKFTRPIVKDKHSLLAVAHPDDKNLEIITKEYKFKLFVTGKFQIPGILSEDMGDLLPPLEKLIDFLRPHFPDIALEGFHANMRNYKFKTLHGGIDIRDLLDFCLARCSTRINTHTDTFSRILIKPFWKELEDFNPRVHTWESLQAKKITNPKLDTKRIADFLRTDCEKRNLSLTYENLKKWCKEPVLIYAYTRVWKFLKFLRINHFRLSQGIVESIITEYLADTVSIVIKQCIKHSDNHMNDAKYDQEKYPGMLIYIKTPTENKLDKKTTIKIFPGGKINVDGANNIEEASYIYWWLNNIFHKKRFIYPVDYVHNGSDSEFSESESIEENIVLPNFKSILGSM